MNLHTPITARKTEFNPHRIFVDRWSPRGFSTDAITADELNTLFDAARWAPSASNTQPWRFLYALRGQAAFETFVSTLVEFNQIWARHAAALVYVLSKTSFVPPGKSEPVFSRSHSFDAGAAWANFANQAALSGWVAHGMGGFDRDAARKALGVPDGFELEIAVAVGRKGDGAHLSEALRQREQPSDRLAVSEIAASGAFPERFAGPKG